MSGIITYMLSRTDFNIVKYANMGNENNDFNTEKLLEKLNKMTKKNLGWVLEARLLCRFLVESLKETRHGNTMNLLAKYKEKATQHVEELWNGIRD